MGLKNLLIVGLLVWGGFVLWRRWQALSRRTGGNTYGGRMVRCAECGVYLPANDAVQIGSGKFSCASHPVDPRAQ